MHSFGNVNKALELYSEVLLSDQGNSSLNSLRLEALENSNLIVKEKIEVNRLRKLVKLKKNIFP